MYNIIFYALTALLGFALFTSKSAFAILAWLTLFMAVPMIDWKKIVTQDKWLLATIALYPAAIIVNLFSIGGADSAIHTANSWPFILLAIPFYVIWNTPKFRDTFQKMAFASLLLACGYSIYLLITQHNGVFTGGERIASYYDVSRWGMFTCCAFLALVILVHSDIKRGFRIAYSVALVLALGCLVLSNSRAPFIGAFVALTFLGLFANKRFLKSFLVVGAVGLAVIVVSPKFQDRLYSIIKVQQTESGQFTSDNTSNAGRLYMWAVASDFWKEQPFFGTGLDNTERLLKNFLSRQPAEYQKKYTVHTFSYTDQHNSYLMILVQMGLIYFVYFALTMGWILFKAWDRETLKTSPERQFAWAGIIAFMITAFFYAEMMSFGAIVFWPLFPLLFYRKENSLKVAKY